MTACFSLFCALAAAQPAEYSAPRNLGDPMNVGRGIQRTMELLASSTPEHRNTVRILLYGQSITAGEWGKLLGDHLRATYPHANLIFERRPLSGFSTERLVKTARADLYPFYPDLVIFHDYGNNDDYETMIRELRSQTTSEILIQADHLRRSEQVIDESKPDSIEDPRQRIAAYRNEQFLPQIAARYDCGFDDRRQLWKAYLRQYNLQPGDLVKDDVHPNEHGTYLMTELVKAYMVRRDDVQIDPMNCSYVTTYNISDLAPSNGETLQFEFTGNRIDAVFTEDATRSCQALIDGRKPLSMPERYYHGRNRVRWRDTGIPPGPWPAVLKMGFQEPLVEETWTLHATQDPNNPKVYTFSVSGSTTGDDGSGRTDERFVSDSGRVVIEAEDWDVNFSIVVLRRLPEPPAEFQLDWSVAVEGADEVAPPAVQPGVERTATIAQRLTDKSHVLELTGGIEGLRALRVYSPARFMTTER